MPTKDCSVEAVSRFKEEITEAQILQWAGIDPQSPDAQELTADIKGAIKQYIPKDRRLSVGIGVKRTFRIATQHLRDKWTDAAKLPGLSVLEDRQLWFERVRVGYVLRLIRGMINEDWIVQPLPVEANEHMGDASRSAQARSTTKQPVVRNLENAAVTKPNYPNIDSKDKSAATSTTSTTLPDRSSMTPLPQLRSADDQLVASNEEGNSMLTVLPLTSSLSNSPPALSRQPSITVPPPLRAVQWEHVVGRVDVKSLDLEDIEDDAVHISLSQALNDEQKEVDFEKLRDAVVEGIQEASDNPEFVMDWSRYKLFLRQPGAEDHPILGRIHLCVAMIKWQKTDQEDMDLILKLRGVKRAPSESLITGQGSSKRASNN